jgi:hypothetical protein
VLIFSLLHARVSTEIALPAAFYEGMADAVFQQVTLFSLSNQLACSVFPASFPMVFFIG